MTWEIVLNILKWITLIGASAIIATLAFLISMFIIATALYIIPYFRKKIDLKTIVNEKYENRIYIDEAKYIVADKELQEKIDAKDKLIDEKNKKLEELQKDIIRESGSLKSIVAQARNKQTK